MTKQPFIVSAWSNGKDSFGLRISPKDCDRLFDKEWEDVELEIDGNTISVGITDSFWDDCIELRSQEIKHWFESEKLIPWKKHHPPKITMKHIADNQFKVIGVA